MNNFIAGPAKVDAFLNGQLMFTAKTILDSSINLSTNKEEVRGGQGTPCGATTTILLLWPLILLILCLSWSIWL